MNIHITSLTFFSYQFPHHVCTRTFQVVCQLSQDFTDSLEVLTYQFRFQNELLTFWFPSFLRISLWHEESIWKAWPLHAFTWWMPLPTVVKPLVTLVASTLTAQVKHNIAAFQLESCKRSARNTFRRSLKSFHFSKPFEKINIFIRTFSKPFEKIRDIK